MVAPARRAAGAEMLHAGLAGRVTRGRPWCATIWLQSEHTFEWPGGEILVASWARVETSPAPVGELARPRALIRRVHEFQWQSRDP